MRAAELDAATWNWILARSRDQTGQCALVQARARADVAESELDAIERALAELHRLQALTNGAIATLDGDVAAPLVSRLGRLRDQAKTLMMERQRILVRHANLQAAALLLDRLSDQRGAVDSLTYQERRVILEMLGVQVWVWPKSHEPRYVIKMETGPDPSDDDATHVGDLGAVIATSATSSTREQLQVAS